MKNRLLFGLTLFQITFINLVFAQTPNLGIASSYALFTTVGAFNNVGESYILGDIGTDNGAFTGFPPGIIEGQTHIDDSVSATSIMFKTYYSLNVNQP